MIQILFALLAGVLTIAAPCILPMLPILLGASIGQTSRQRPIYIVIGFIISFAAASFLLSGLVDIFLRLHIFIWGHQIMPRDIAIVFLAIFGLLMLWPNLFEKLTANFGALANKSSQVSQSAGTGNWGAFVLGLLLGVIWAPCAGPVLGAILTLIATQGNTFKSTILLIAYALGAGLPMLAIAYGSQWLTTRVRSIAKYSSRLQQIFGVLVLLLAAAMFFQYDVTVVNSLTSYFPQNSLEQKLTGTESAKTDLAANQQTQPTIMQKIAFENYGPAPEF